MDINMYLLQWLIIFQIKKTELNMENGFMPNKELAEQLHKPIIRKFEKRKVQ